MLSYVNLSFAFIWWLLHYSKNQ